MVHNLTTMASLVMIFYCRTPCPLWPAETLLNSLATVVVQMEVHVPLPVR